MKTLLRNFLINFASLLATSHMIPGLFIDGGIRTLALGAVGLMVLNMAVIPLLKIMFLPLNLLTLGLFTWVINVIALYLLTTVIPQIKLIPYHFPGANLGMIIVPEADLNVLYVAVIVSFIVGFISHFLEWLAK